MSNTNGQLQKQQHCMLCFDLKVAIKQNFITTKKPLHNYVNEESLKGAERGT